VGFGLGLDTQIPSKTKKSQTQPKNHQNLDSNIQKFLKFFPNPRNPNRFFLGKFSGFWDIWVKVLVIFGTYGSCLGWDFLGFGCPNPTQNPRYFWVQMYELIP
jgi:hypothetical protein